MLTMRSAAPIEPWNHLGLVYRTARQLARRIPNSDADELAGAGVLGLIQAASAFDPDRGVTFSTFAVPRIRGAMLDDVRRRTTPSRLAVQRKRRLQWAVRKVETESGRRAEPRAVAGTLELSLDEYNRWQDSTLVLDMVELDAPRRLQDGESANPLEALADAGASSPEDAVEKEDMRRAVRESLASLSVRERAIVESRFFRGETLRTIADREGVTEARISQLLTRALARLAPVLRHVLDLPSRTDGKAA
ncbi:MAG: sigma-70 family RNA polymerase sigma factor [Gemmatimonadales bacterium]